jgi:4-hydroxybenzoate polyprenyltransferase
LSALLSRKYRYLALKFLALLSIVRWYNILLLVIAQYLAAFLVLRPISQWRESVLDYRLHLIIFASGLVIAAGFIINNIYDQEKYLIHRPQQTLFERLISRSTTLQFFFLFNALAALLAFMVSWRATVFYLSYAAALWLYSHKWKKLTFIGNFTAAILAITPFFGIFFYFGESHWDLFLYVSFMLFLELSRELVKDMEALKGDVIIGYPTLPVVLGIRKTKAVLLIINFISFIPAFLVYDYFSLPVFTFLVSCLMGITAVNFYLSFDDDPHRIVIVNRWYKVFVISSVLSLSLFAL